MAVKKAKATASTPRVTPVAIVKPTGNVVVEEPEIEIDLIDG